MKIDRGVVAAISAAVLFGLSTPLAKTLVGGTPPLLLAGLLYVGSGSGLAVLLVIRAAPGGRGRITWPRGTDVWWLLGAIAAGGAIGPYLLMYGLKATDSASASLILNLEGVFTALLAWFVFKENLDRRIASPAPPWLVASCCPSDRPFVQQPLLDLGNCWRVSRLVDRQ